MSAVISRTSDPTPHLEEVSPAPLGPADTRVKVAAAGFTLFDAFSAANHALLGLPDVIGHGFDFSGTVIEVGAEVHALAPGDRVAGVHAETIAAARAQATEVVVPAADVARLPPRLSLDRAAAVPLSALTARQGLDLLRPDGGRLLVTGGPARSAAGRSPWQRAMAGRPMRSPAPGPSPSRGRPGPHTSSLKYRSRSTTP